MKFCNIVDMKDIHYTVRYKVCVNTFTKLKLGDGKIGAFTIVLQSVSRATTPAEAERSTTTITTFKL